jgi:hypothetical protein
MPPPLISTVLSFPLFQPVAVYVIFLVFPSLYGEKFTVRCFKIHTTKREGCVLNWSALGYILIFGNFEHGGRNFGVLGPFHSLHIFGNFLPTCFVVNKGSFIRFILNKRHKYSNPPPHIVTLNPISCVTESGRLPHYSYPSWGLRHT